MGMEKEGIVYLVSFVILGTIVYLHSLNIFDPFNELSSSPAWIFITVGISLGMILQKGIDKI